MYSDQKYMQNIMRNIHKGSRESSKSKVNTAFNISGCIMPLQAMFQLSEQDSLIWIWDFDASVWWSTMNYLVFKRESILYYIITYILWKKVLSISHTPRAMLPWASTDCWKTWDMVSVTSPTQVTRSYFFSVLSWLITCHYLGSGMETENPNSKEAGLKWDGKIKISVIIWDTCQSRKPAP